MRSSSFTLAFTVALFATATAADKTILIAPTSTNVKRSLCLDNAYYGQYGNPLQDVYVVSEDCAMEAISFMSAGSMTYMSEDRDSRLVWLQEAGVDDSLSAQEPSFADRILGIPEALASMNLHALEGRATSKSDDQVIMPGPNVAPPSTTPKLLHLSATSALMSIPNSLLPVLDLALPKYVVPVALPTTPLEKYPVDPRAAKRLASITANLRFDPSIASIISELQYMEMKRDIRYLTGEAGSGILSRHSFSTGALMAANWIQDQIERSGAICEQQEFLRGFAPNVICRYPATIPGCTETTILSAHYDSRGSFGYLRAPGGDDDGSGTTLVLAIARVIRERRIKFETNFELVLFAGEEQGLYGSRDYAESMRERKANIVVHIQNDMLAYRDPSEPPQLGLPAVIGTPEAAQLVANVSRIYVPDLAVGYTYACCSDHQSFHEQGFPATQLFERAGPIIDPAYHTSGDISDREGYDFVQLLAITKVAFATILEVVGFDH
ncbi:hypothetical protein FRB94_011718 [Tulasnella sp. JGI-2019a]|nr:hypothetical protein FRB93_010141 [Tulasnella sp. JGI-2019a]KAG8992332.1 hypothetical protein FRB94_011718 [Tulasnella sp. JGI-2019a]KAG9024546.1 hypothetical protein FRB95_011363 [Tulasnella sp. JGI-2019a]